MNLNVDFSKMSADQISKFIDELKARASGLNSHYLGGINPNDLLYARGKRLPDIGILGNPNGYFVSAEINKRYQITSEYFSLSQEFAHLGYKRLKEIETVEPSAFSNILNIFLERRKNLEDRVMQILGTINTVLKSIINIIYELKELDRNLDFYDKSRSSDKNVSQAAEQELKRIFIDNVDARKGGASLLSLSRSASQNPAGPGYVDIVSVFYAINGLDDVEKLNRNEMYKNILRNRRLEYEDWKKMNESDLRTRRALLLQYLESQAASFEFYKKTAYQDLVILKRMNLKGVSNAGEYQKKTSVIDFSEYALFTIDVMAYKEVYLGNYNVEWKSLFGGSKKIMLPVNAVQKTINPIPINRGPRESEAAFIRRSIKKYGPKVIAGIEMDFLFKEKQMFPKEMPQVPTQYEGAIDIKFNPYCFTLEEWYLFTKASVALIDKTVFEGVNSVSVTSLNAIKKELDHYLDEARKAREEKKVKKEESLAMLDIYNSFKEDVMSMIGIGRNISQSKTGGKNFDRELYEIGINNRFSRSLSMKDAIKLGLFVSITDTEAIYEEFKKRMKLLNDIPKFAPFELK
ncbi:MAG: hypothetical protein OH316_01650 [Candidatus Parvarchaeota archaeon]|nr:hypothetical protein [Candidatus Parvarchaeota archaeon]